MEGSTARQLVRWGAVVAYAGLIFALSAQPRVPSVGSDKVAHFVEYAVLAGLIVHALSSSVVVATPAVAGVAWLAASLYGVSDEWHQSFVAGRHASARDALADCLGAGVAAGILLALAKWRKQRSESARTATSGGGE